MLQLKNMATLAPTPLLYRKREKVRLFFAFFSKKKMRIAFLQIASLLSATS